MLKKDFVKKSEDESNGFNSKVKQKETLKELLKSEINLNIHQENKSLERLLEIEPKNLDLDEDDLENILWLRLVVITIYELKKRGDFFKELPLAVDFAVLVLLKNEPSAFFEHVDGVKGVKGTKEIEHGANKHAQVKKYVNDLLGFSWNRGSYNNNKNKWSLKAEKLADISLFPEEKDWAKMVKDKKVLGSLI